MSRRILFVSSHAKLGGAERYLEILMSGLRDTDCEVVCLENGPFVDRLESLGFNPEVIETSRHMSGIIGSALRMRKRLRGESRPSVIHANNLKAALVAGLAGLGRSVPMVWVKHDFSGDGLLTGFVGRLSQRIVGVVTAVTETFGRNLQRRVLVIPNGIPPIEADRAAARESVVELLGTSSGPVVGLVGRLHPWKGQTELIAAAPAVLARFPEARFLLIGGEDPSTPDYAASLRSEIRSGGLEDRVQLVGYRSDAVTIIAGLDLLVMPSVRDESGDGRDAFPFVGLESMAVGTPVIAYADGGLPEMFGECGALVPPRDRGALADTIGELLGDDPKRERMAECGRRRVATRYTADEMVSAMGRIYEELSGT